MGPLSSPSDGRPAHRQRPVLLRHRSAETRGVAGAIVTVDLALVTAATIFSGGALSATAIFYVWPIVFAALPTRLGALRRRGRRRGRLRRRVGAADAGLLSATTPGAQVAAPSAWCSSRYACTWRPFFSIALLAGRLATALVRSTAQLGTAKADTEAQLLRMRAANEQLRAMGESSRVFLRYQDVDELMPKAIATWRAWWAGAPVLPWSTTTTAANTTRRPPHGRPWRPGSSPEGARHHRARTSGIPPFDKATDPRSAICSRSSRRTAYHSFLVAPLEAKNELLGVVCLLYRRASR